MRKKGFTIIELLVVISIIAMLMAILGAGIFSAKDAAKVLQQRCQLREIEIGMELWYNEQDGEYPESESLGDTLYTNGAHHLAEALIGRDGHGFDRKSTWDAELDEASGLPYISGEPWADREGMYLSSKVARGFQLAQIYGETVVSDSGSVYPGDFDELGTATENNTAMVLTDVYTENKVTMPFSDKTVKVGSPILYYKAKSTNMYDWSDDTNIEKSIFNYYDNYEIMELGKAGEPIVEHPFFTAATGIESFYEEWIDPKSRLIDLDDDGVEETHAPYNKESYILLSAGKDGLYGTRDDVTNVSK